MGLARGEVFIANTLKCRPPGNRDPQEPELAACLPYLRAQIALVGPEVICTLGRHATHALLERTDSLSRLRGRFHDYHGTPLLPTFHPSYLLRTPGDKPAAWTDLLRLKENYQRDKEVPTFTPTQVVEQGLYLKGLQSGGKRNLPESDLTIDMSRQ